jgi:hypothetical protein
VLSRWLLIKSSLSARRPSEQMSKHQFNQSMIPLLRSTVGDPRPVVPQPASPSLLIQEKPAHGRGTPFRGVFTLPWSVDSSSLETWPKEPNSESWYTEPGKWCDAARVQGLPGCDPVSPAMTPGGPWWSVETETNKSSPSLPRH